MVRTRISLPEGQKSCARDVRGFLLEVEIQMDHGLPNRARTPFIGEMEVLATANQSTMARNCTCSHLFKLIGPVE